jgi:hypothetical protein
MTPRVVCANWLASKERSGSKGNLVLLFVNRESRAEALKRYKKLPGDDYIYADFSQDTMFIDSFFDRALIEHSCYSTLREHEPQIQILAIDHEF